MKIELVGDVLVIEDSKFTDLNKYPYVDNFEISNSQVKLKPNCKSLKCTNVTLRDCHGTYVICTLDLKKCKFGKVGFISKNVILDKTTKLLSLFLTENACINENVFPHILPFEYKNVYAVEFEINSNFVKTELSKLNNAKVYIIKKKVKRDECLTFASFANIDLVVAAPGVALKYEPGQVDKVVYNADLSIIELVTRNFSI